LAGGAAITFWVTKHPRITLPATLLVALVYTGYYLPHYFRSFATLPTDAFRRHIRAAIDNRGERAALDVVAPWLEEFGEDELRYYLIRWGRYDCRGSEQALRELRERPHDPRRSPRRRKH
jgi:hypothetical protein